MDYEEPEVEEPVEALPDFVPRFATVVCSLPQIPAMGQFGAVCWSGQVWPWGKSTPGKQAAGGQPMAWGDLTHEPGTFLRSMTREQLEQANKERAACCMPLLEDTHD